MPFTLGPLTRRSFIQSAVGFGAAMAMSRHGLADEPASPLPGAHIALLSDTHIATDSAKVNRKQNMTDNLRKIVQQVLAADPRPTVAFVNGDLALQQGDPGDYAQFFALIQPLREAGLTIHMTLGNHDQRDHFMKALKQTQPASPVDNKYVSVVPVGNTNWFLLDSLDETTKTPGTLGEAQLRWLGASLKEHADQPAIILVHHDPAFEGHKGWLTDSEALYQTLAPHPHAKALLYGHLHVWTQARHDVLQLINLPATAYTFAAGAPLGWVQAAIDERQLRMTLRTLGDHPDNGHSFAVTL